MIDILRHLKLREPEGHFIPEGPKFLNSKNFEVNIDASVLRFKAPKHAPMQGTDAVIPQSEYMLDDLIYQPEKKVENIMSHFVAHSFFITHGLFMDHCLQGHGHN